MEIEDGERRGADHLRGPAPLKEAQVSLYPWGTAFDRLSPRSPSSQEPDTQQGQRHADFPAPPSQVKQATFLEESDSLGPTPNPVTF